LESNRNPLSIKSPNVPLKHFGLAGYELLVALTSVGVNWPANALSGSFLNHKFTEPAKVNRSDNPAIPYGKTVDIALKNTFGQRTSPDRLGKGPPSLNGSGLFWYRKSHGRTEV
jgi:hypothetical protein